MQCFAVAERKAGALLIPKRVRTLQTASVPDGQSWRQGRGPEHGGADPVLSQHTGEESRLGGRICSQDSLGEARASHASEQLAYLSPGDAAAELGSDFQQFGSVDLLSLCSHLAFVPPETAVLGVDRQGTPMLVRFSASEVAHVLIRGKSGCGKSALVRTMLVSLAMYNLQRQVQIVLLNPGSRRLAPLRNLPHVLGPIVSDPREVRDCLRWLAGEVEHRRRNQSDEPCLIVAIDELNSVLATPACDARALLSRIAQAGSEAGVHLLACISEEASILNASNELDALFPVQIEDARSDLSAHGLNAPDSRGSFQLSFAAEQVFFRAAWLGRDDLAHIECRLRAGVPGGYSLGNMHMHKLEKSPIGGKEHHLSEQPTRTGMLRSVLQRLAKG